MAKREIKISDRKRLVVVVLGIFTLFSLLVFQFFRIQIIDSDHWNAIAKRQHFFTVKEPFQRGTFWSNTSIKRGHPEKPQRFVFDIQKFHIYIDPVSIPKEHHNFLAQTLIDAIGIAPENQAAFRANFDKKSRSRRLAMWLDSEEKDVILSWWQQYAKQNKIVRNALYFVPDYKRSYPFGKLLGQVLHTIQDQRDEVTGRAIPTGGMELAFDHYLKGHQGKRMLKRSPRHSFETGRVLNEPEDGADIYLTINHYLQAIAEEEVEKGVKRCHAKSGWAVMMDPYTGGILALAQYPFFSPSHYRDYFNDNEKIEWTKVKALTDANEPASVMKPLTLSIALMANDELLRRGEKPLFDPNEKIPTADGKFPGRKDLHDVRRHNYLNMEMALQKSSNIYMARLTERIVDRLGNEWYRSALQETFGLGLKTNLELPAESPGVLPKPGRLHANGALEWSRPTPFSLAIGHNLQVNTIQLLRAFAVLANGGYLVQPTLVRQVVKTNSEGGQQVVVDNTQREGEDVFPRVLSPKIASQVVRAMKYVTKPGGTGRRADIYGYTEVGKTGTANKIVDGAYSKSKYVANFVGFAPVKHPAFVLVVMMDEPDCHYIPGLGHNYYGSVSAAPVFKEISKRALEYLGIPPDDPHGYPPADPRHDPQLADWYPEMKALQALYEKWN